MHPFRAAGRPVQDALGPGRLWSSVPSCLSVRSSARAPMRIDSDPLGQGRSVQTAPPLAHRPLGFPLGLTPGLPLTLARPRTIIPRTSPIVPRSSPIVPARGDDRVRNRHDADDRVGEHRWLTGGRAAVALVVWRVSLPGRPRPLPSNVPSCPAVVAHTPPRRCRRPAGPRSAADTRTVAARKLKSRPAASSTTRTDPTYATQPTLAHASASEPRVEAALPAR